ncbi:MAG: hypothetical protein ACRDDH_03525 [Cetobacterium sp.]|uniref:hypothetical protein n=1 Tax=Cetobacterium sp. TaxID=2071632 RepID=UPI003EE50D1C
MNEIIFFEKLIKNSLRNKKSLRSSKLLCKVENGKFLNEHWHYEVDFAFRDALDIQYTKKSENKQSTKEWTQGVYINFKQGDTLHRKDNSDCIQVVRAMPTMLNSIGEYQEGIVVYYKYKIDESGKYSLANLEEKKHFTQKEFLYYLITGRA